MKQRLLASIVLLFSLVFQFTVLPVGAQQQQPSAAFDRSRFAIAHKKFIRPGEVVWLGVGDLRKIEAGVRELGFGEVIKLNADGEPIN